MKTLYLWKRGNVYQFRRKVPKDLLSIYYPETQVGCTLNTEDRREAEVRARAKAVETDKEFDEARRRHGAPAPVSLSQGEIDQLAAIKLHDIMADDDRMRQGGLSERLYEMLWNGVEEGENALKLALARSDTSMVEDDVRDLLAAQGIKLTGDAGSHHRLGIAVLTAHLKGIDMIAERLNGNLVPTPPLPSGARLETSKVNTEDGENPTLTAIFDQWRGEAHPVGKTVTDYRAQLRRFQEIVGRDLRVKEVQAGHLRAFRDAMLRMPTRLTHKQRTMTVPEILAAFEGHDDVDRMAPRTVRDKSVAAIKALLGYAVQNGFRDDNPASKIKVMVKRATEPSRLGYSDDDLATIFGSPVFTEKHRPAGGGGDAAHWLPLLAAFTGARLEELGRLSVLDVGVEGGISYLSINAADPGKSIKNAASRRKVPIHSELIALGFLSYVDQLRAHGEALVFPGLRSKTEKATAAWSKWWGRYARGIGIINPKKVFHSFRHTVKRALRDVGVARTLRDAIQGHASQDEAEQYGLDEEGLGVSLATLRDAMERLVYPGLDLRHLYVAQMIPGERGRSDISGANL